MSTFETRAAPTLAVDVAFEGDTLRVRLSDGREVAAPLEAVHENIAEYAHEAGEQNVVSIQLVDRGGERSIEVIAVREGAMLDHPRRNAESGGDAQAARVSAIADDTHDARGKVRSE